MHSLEIKLWRQMSSVYSIFRILDPVNLYQISVERRVKSRYSSEICNNGDQKSGFLLIHYTWGGTRRLILVTCDL